MWKSFIIWAANFKQYRQRLPGSLQCRKNNGYNWEYPEIAGRIKYSYTIATTREKHPFIGCFSSNPQPGIYFWG
jgi:hypothetical protein